MALRLLVRAAPFVLGAVAAAIWLRRRQPERPAPPARTGAPVRATPAPAEDPRPAGKRSHQPPTGRFERTPVDIVTVVDDLLGAAR
jgi:hypothetical protein